MKISVLLILVFIAISSGPVYSNEKYYNKIRDFLLDEFNEIPTPGSLENYAKNDKWWFKRQFKEDNYDIRYHYFKSKKDTIIEDYGRMFKYINLGLYTFPDSLICDKYMIGIFLKMDAMKEYAKKLASADSLSTAIKTPPGIIIQFPNSIIRVRARGTDYIDYRDDRDDNPNSNSWKRMAKRILKEINPEGYRRIYVCYSGYIELIDSDFWSD